MKEIAIARVNNVNLIVCQDANQLVPIRPICDALGIDVDAQRNRINRDEILSSVTAMTTATGGDGKQYEMVALPMEFIFGWLMSIDTSRVNPEAKDAVIRYKLECHKALFHYFAGAQTFLKEKQAIIDSMTREYFELQTNFKEARQKMMEGKRNLQEVLAIDYDTWIGNSRQLLIPFEAERPNIEED